jgi:dUTP pyrophosphatase
MNVTVRVKRLRPGAQIPAYQSANAAGMDLVADLGGTVLVAPGQRRSIPTGIALQISPGFEGQVRPRSGRAIREGLTIINTPGTIDADYRGEVMVLIVNLGDETIEIHPGDRIAQLVIAPVTRVEVIEVGDLEPSGRGGGGFGHTGR